MSLEGKKVILAITGSIAAYKTPQLVRLLVKAGASVQVIMTEAAADFVSPLALSTVSQKEVYASVRQGAQWNNHVALGRWADVLLIAPCSANTLAKMAHGLCDNMVQAVYLSACCPVFIAPAMDEDMWQHPATKANMATLHSFGHHLVPVGHGELASGLVGEGRMAEPEEITARLSSFFNKIVPAPREHRVLITAGPTYESIDPVRFIGNHSTGKMGVALALAWAEHGWAVDLVLGPSKESCTHPLVKTYAVQTAREMLAQCLALFPQADVAILSAAVSDYRPDQVAEKKIKKDDGETLSLNLVKNPDILAQLGQSKREDQVVVGFALETDHELDNARKKLQAKNADLIVLNSLQDKGAGFGHDTNKVTLIPKEGSSLELALQSKTDTAKSIVDYVIALK